MSAPAVVRVQRIPKASRPQPCGSPWSCEGVQAGQPAAYVGTGDGLIVACAPCADRFDAGESVAAPTTAVIADEWPEDALEPEQLVTGVPGEPLCPCSRGERAGFHNVGTATEQRWVHSVCGLPAYAGQAPAATPGGGVPDEPTEVEPAAGEHDIDLPTPDPAEAELEGDDPTEACTCRRTSRSTLERGDDGLVRHKSKKCGKPIDPQPEPENTEETTSDDRGADDGAADRGTDPGAGPGDGEPTGLAHGAARRGEGDGEGGRGSGEGAVDVDPGRGDAAGARGDAGGDDPQPAHSAPVEGEPAGGLALRQQGVQGGGPDRVGEVGVEVDRVAPRPGEVAPQALGGLAAFYAQPADEDDAAPGPVATLADFYAQPDEDADDVPPWGGPVEAPDSDNYLGEFGVAELALELGRRAEIGGAVTALVVADGTGVERIVRVPR